MSAQGDGDKASRRLLIIANDALGDRMAGPAIRTWELGRVLSRHVDVDLAVPPFVESTAAVQPDFDARVHVCRRTSDLRELVSAADILMTLGAVPLACPFLMRADKPLILDAYDPFLLAGLELHKEDLEKRMATNEHYRRAHALGLSAADLVLCASERQRDYWLGMMSALGRVNPSTYDGDPTLGRLLRVVPFGLPGEPPRHTRPSLKGVHPGIGKDDKVVLWGGGLWDWLDAGTAIRAMSRVSASRRDVKLFFMGTRRPNPAVSRMSALDEAIELSRQLGLLDRSVIFNDEWVPYTERQNHLIEADVGLCLHRDVLETRFAFRTRLLDYVWSGLPAVTTGGDALGDEMNLAGLARSVAAGDDHGVADAILELLETPDLRSRVRPRFEAMAVRYRWETVAAPLVEFCRNPRTSPDKARHRNRRNPRDLLAAWRRVAAHMRRTLGGRRRQRP